MRRPYRRRRPHPAALLCAAYAILLLCWGGANPPFTAPDEWSHYLRALGVGSGAPIGPATAYPLPADASERTRRQYDWINQAARLVPVPPGLLAANLDCNAGKVAQSAACLSALAPDPAATRQVTPVGNYQLLPYIGPGLAARLARDPFTADYAGRFAAGATCWALLALALALLWTGHAPSLLGLLVAFTPMAAFLASSLTPSGVEIVAGLAFAAALLRLWRTPRPPAWVWLALGLTGCTLALSRSTGALYVGIDLLIFGALVGPRGLLQRLNAARLGAALATALLVGGAALNQWWERAYGSKLHAERGEVLRELPAALHRLPSVLHEEIGVFGPLDTVLPPPLVASWAALVVALLALALLVGTWHERAVLVATALGNLAVPIGFSMLLVSATTFDVQGRHVLPLAVMVPLLAGELISRHRDRLPAAAMRATVAALTLGIGLLHVAAWYWNGRRHAVGVAGRRWFIAQAAWSPPLGWTTWFVIAACGGLLWLLAALALRPHTPAEPTPAPNPAEPIRAP